MTHDTACTCDHCRMTVEPQTSTAPPAFTRELLEVIVARRSAAGDYYTQDTNALAAFALTLMAERDEALADVVNHESWLTTQQAETYRAEIERDEARRELAEAEEAIRLLAPMHCEDCGGTGDLWHGPPDDPQQIQCSTCRASGTVSSKYANDPQVLTHPAVRRALERGKA